MKALKPGKATLPYNEYKNKLIQAGFEQHSKTCFWILLKSHKDGYLIATPINTDNLTIIGTPEFYLNTEISHFTITTLEPTQSIDLRHFFLLKLPVTLLGG